MVNNIFIDVIGVETYKNYNLLCCKEKANQV